MSEFFIDGDMLQPGDQEAVRQSCGIAAERLGEIAKEAKVGHDDILDHVLSALRRIADGESPNEAFGWAQDSRGRRPGNHALRNFVVRQTVQTRMRNIGEARTKACFSVSSESEEGVFLLGFELIKSICKGLTKDSKIPFPENIYPIDPVRYLR
ncbi:hypothetical protein H0A65_04750 [Alcaligenaceae bacterium]|nr:hypothetical protein [Alcaligenaceae bacterium]